MDGKNVSDRTPLNGSLDSRYNAIFKEHQEFAQKTAIGTVSSTCGTD